ncbi:Fic family protein [Paenibacillus melissococcoides]|uniref:Fic family protein n=1 Tax=Paenibacillus melissococcoides TaxID=2912268 RepID=A0ABM9G9B7_9BACL|nr:MULTISPECIES: Fic family protein [Paenibacillus]MEB9892476.1 Fic family protein [Bacillus cereus]CAH8248276.1 Fic family protein [Paenibacillus melissococcoides]CAH8717966.1 Fic family protein [Paenibacillus melissococcoides]CAH8719156.1 Fic family protein [Paenibacillus melissococcoides]GIO78644.1 Fic family protein [Paenibacillus dendritiformis]
MVQKTELLYNWMENKGRTMYFFDEKFKKLSLDLETVSLIGRINYYKGWLEVYEKEFPCILENLHKAIKVQQAQDFFSMHKHLKITSKRLKELLIYNKAPKTTIENEISCCYDTLTFIHNKCKYSSIDPSFILEIHFQLFKYASSDSGTWRKNEKVIPDNLDLKLPIYCCHEPVASAKIPAYMEQLCREYNELIEEGVIDPLILIAHFIFHFICISPFEYGNERIARLLLYFLLLKSKHSLVKYISLDKLIKKYETDYFESLTKSSANWNFQEYNITFILHCLLSIILEAYTLLDADYQMKKNKSDKIKVYIMKQEAPFTKEDIRTVFADVSQSTINKVFECLQKENAIKLLSRGRNAKWIKNTTIS